MILTKLSKENIDYFKPALGGIGINPEQLGIGAIEDGKAVGAAVFSSLNELLIVDYIYVDEQYRRQGIAKNMIEQTAEALKPERILTSFLEDEKELGDFFRNLGFFVAPDTEYYSIPVESFLESDAIQKLLKKKPTGKVETIDEMKHADKYELLGNLRAHAAQEIFDQDELFMPLSMVTYLAGTEIVATCAFCEKHSKDIIVTLITSFNDDVTNIMNLFSAFAQAVVKLNLTDCNIHFVNANEGIKKVVEKLVPGVKNNCMMLSAIR